MWGLQPIPHSAEFQTCGDQAIANHIDLSAEPDFGPPTFAEFEESDGGVPKWVTSTGGRMRWSRLPHDLSPAELQLEEQYKEALRKFQSLAGCVSKKQKPETRARNLEQMLKELEKGRKCFWLLHQVKAAIEG